MHTQKARETQLVTVGRSSSLKLVVKGARKSSGYSSDHLSDSDWEADSERPILRGARQADVRTDCPECRLRVDSEYSVVRRNSLKADLFC